MEPGRLYIVATPIGNLGDITYRAVEVLGQVDIIAAEDTRHSKKLLNHYAIHTPLISFHEHNEDARSMALVQRIQNGETVALISDAGTPLISDPGFRLVSQARTAGIDVIPVPGSSAIMAALSAGGLPTDRFVFEGFLPAKTEARRKRLQVLKNEPRTLVIYESCHRISGAVRDMSEIMGTGRRAVLAREITKQFESFYSGRLEQILQWLEADPNQRRGEFVVLIKGDNAAVEDSGNGQIRRIITLLLAELPLKKAVQLGVKITGASRNDIYALALEINREIGSG